MTVLPSPEVMIVICTVILIAYTAHVLDKAFASSEQFEAMLSARDRIIGLEAENAKLRELVRELLPCYQWSDCYGGCMAADGPLCPRPAKLTERARELGVEVAIHDRD